MAIKASQKQRPLELAAGRTVDQQIQWIREHGNHGVHAVLRARVLHNLGIPQSKQTAENIIVFGCYVPFELPVWLRDSFDIFDLLGVDCTYLEKEICCGAPMITTNIGAEQAKAIEVSREFVRMTLEMGERKGAKAIVYCCGGCAHLAKRFFPDQAVRSMYLLDLIVEKAKKESLKVAPTAVGYFWGCHTIHKILSPNIGVDWTRYRQFLDGVEGLRIVDLPRNICCRVHPERAIEAALKENLDTIISQCNGCYYRLSVAAGGKVKVKHFPEIVLEGLRKRKPPR